MVIVFIGAICDYYFGAIGAVLGALVMVAALSRAKANLILPSLLLVGLAWGAGQLLAGNFGALIGVVSATALAVWLEIGGRAFTPGNRRPQMSSRDSAGS
jgi:hypothetical protein